METVLPFRVAWGEFPDVEIVASESAVKWHPRYAEAKSGNLGAGYAMSKEFVTSATLDRVAKMVGSGGHKWLPVVGSEDAGVNRIPMCLAGVLDLHLGGETAETIVQVNRAGHTGASGWDRLVSPALFEGSVQEGERYVLVDDFIGQGGTLANLRGYVEANGGNVVGAVCLTGQSRSAVLRLSASTLRELQSKHGNELDDLWWGWFGYGVDRLTESEARYLIRVEDVDAIRNRIVEAGRRRYGESR